MSDKRFISHRGNLTGPNSAVDGENSPKAIDKAIKFGLDVEIDLWATSNDKLYLGHDDPNYEISWSFLSDRWQSLWIHCKNIEAMDRLYGLNSFNFFGHDKDDFVITSRGYIWTFPGTSCTKNSISVLPERINKDWNKIVRQNCFGICSDFITQIREAK